MKKEPIRWYQLKILYWIQFTHFQSQALYYMKNNNINKNAHIAQHNMRYDALIQLKFTNIHNKR